MHELSIALSIVDGVSEELQKRGEPVLHAVHLRLGCLSGVVKDALLFCYEQACDGTALAGSKLIVDEDGSEDMEITGMEITER
ncbi:MAG: hydrogenase maturation nickel metallochaperone HypA [Acidobacteriota bacterium]